MEFQQYKDIRDRLESIDNGLGCLLVAVIVIGCAIFLAITAK